MKDSISFPLLLATVLAGAFLAVFDPANRSTSVAQDANSPTLAPASSQTVAVAQHLPS